MYFDASCAPCLAGGMVMHATQEGSTARSAAQGAGTYEGLSRVHCTTAVMTLGFGFTLNPNLVARAGLVRRSAALFGGPCVQGRRPSGAERHGGAGAWPEPVAGRCAAAADCAPGTALCERQRAARAAARCAAAALQTLQTWSQRQRCRQCPQCCDPITLPRRRSGQVRFRRIKTACGRQVRDEAGSSAASGSRCWS